MQDKSNHDLLIKIATDVDWIKKEIEGLKEEVEELKSFKWKIVGMSTLAAFVISSVIVFLNV